MNTNDPREMVMPKTHIAVNPHLPASTYGKILQREKPITARQKFKVNGGGDGKKKIKETLRISVYKKLQLILIQLIYILTNIQSTTNKPQHHQRTNHNINWGSAQCLTYNTNYQRLTLEAGCLVPRPQYFASVIFFSGHVVQAEKCGLHKTPKVRQFV